MGYEGRIVSNAGPLIHLTKIGRLKLLKELFESVIIPRTVKIEVVDRGKEKGAPDAFLIENEVVEKVQRMVYQKYNIELEPEIKIIDEGINLRGILDEC